MIPKMGHAPPTRPIPTVESIWPQLGGKDQRSYGSSNNLTWEKANLDRKADEELYRIMFCTSEHSITNI